MKLPKFRAPKWWAKLPPAQRTLLLVGVPAVAALALYQNLKRGRTPADEGTDAVQGRGQVVVGAGLADMTAQRSYMDALAGLDARNAALMEQVRAMGERAASDRRTLAERIAALADRLAGIGRSGGGTGSTSGGGNARADETPVRYVPGGSVSSVTLPVAAAPARTLKVRAPSVPDRRAAIIARLDPQAQVSISGRVSRTNARGRVVSGRPAQVAPPRVAARPHVSPVPPAPTGRTPQDVQVAVKARRPRVRRSRAGSTTVVGVGVSSSARKRIV